MISGVSVTSSMAVMPASPGNTAASLTAGQRQLIEETLSGFDPEQLTQADAESIVEAFSEAGIQPGQALTQTLGDAGFDARSIGEMAGVGDPQQGGHPPLPPPASQGLNISDDTLQSLNDLLNDYYSGELSEEKQESALGSIKEILQQAAPEGGLIDVTA